MANNSASISSTLDCDNWIVAADGLGASGVCDFNEAIASSICGADSPPASSAERTALVCWPSSLSATRSASFCSALRLSFSSSRSPASLGCCLRASSNACVSRFCCSTSCSTVSVGASSSPACSSGPDCMLRTKLSKSAVPCCSESMKKPRIDNSSATRSKSDSCGT